MNSPYLSYAVSKPSSSSVPKQPQAPSLPAQPTTHGMYIMVVIPLNALKSILTQNQAILSGGKCHSLEHDPCLRLGQMMGLEFIVDTVLLVQLVSTYDGWYSVIIIVLSKILLLIFVTHSLYIYIQQSL